MDFRMNTVASLLLSGICYVPFFPSVSVFGWSWPELGGVLSGYINAPAAHPFINATSYIPTLHSSPDSPLTHRDI